MHNIYIYIYMGVAIEGLEYKLNLYNLIIGAYLIFHLAKCEKIIVIISTFYSYYERDN